LLPSTFRQCPPKIPPLWRWDGSVDLSEVRRAPWLYRRASVALSHGKRLVHGGLRNKIECIIADVSYQTATICLGFVTAVLAWLTVVRHRRNNAEAALIAAPEIVFSCDTDWTISSSERHPLITIGTITVTVTAFNSGSYSTEVIEGEVRFHSEENPNKDRVYPMAGVNIASRTPHVTKFVPPYGSLQSPTGSPAKIVCKAVYTRGKHRNGEARTTYAYDKWLERFVPSH
jgi:hypothetical protein